MDHQDTYNQWRDELNRRLPDLSKPQAAELALWSIGMVLAKRAALTSVALELAAWLKEKYNSIRQRLRDWYRPAEHKSGKNRTDVAVRQHFCALVSWVISLLSGNKIALALDASTRKDDLTVLCVSVLVCGCAIPIAWRILPGNQPDHWQEHWLHLLDQLHGIFGSDKFVVVLTDRGLWAPWLFEAIQKNGWHPLMRINPSRGQIAHYFKAKGHPWEPLSAFVPRKGQQKCLTGLAFKKRSLPCRLIVFFGLSAKEPWYLLTDLAVDQGQWYGLRFWIEHQFKLIKSDGWDWEKSQIKDWDRAERLWLAYAVSLLWAQSFGSHAEEKDVFGESYLNKPIGSGLRHNAFPKRLISVFKKGMALLANAIQQGANILCQKFAPDAINNLVPIPDTS